MFIGIFYCFVILLEKLHSKLHEKLRKCVFRHSAILLQVPYDFYTLFISE